MRSVSKRSETAFGSPSVHAVLAHWIGSQTVIQTRLRDVEDPGRYTFPILSNGLLAQYGCYSTLRLRRADRSVGTHP
jgi:hypothetical protein